MSRTKVYGTVSTLNTKNENIYFYYRKYKYIKANSSSSICIYDVNRFNGKSITRTTNSKKKKYRMIIIITATISTHLNSTKLILWTFVGRKYCTANCVLLCKKFLSATGQVVNLIQKVENKRRNY